MVLSDSRDTMVAKVNLITPQLSTNVFELYHANAIFIDPALIRSNTVFQLSNSSLLVDTLEFPVIAYLYCISIFVSECLT